MKAGGLANFVLVVLFHLLFSGGTVGTNLWLSEWTNDVPVNSTIPIEHAKVWFGGYGGFVAFQGIVWEQILSCLKYSYPVSTSRISMPFN